MTAARYSPAWYDTDPRFEAMRDYLADRPVGHVLDFGALNNRMATQFVQRYQCHVVAVDDSDELTPAKGVDVDRRRLGPSDIRKLGHYDVTLALSVLHHQKQPKHCLRALMDISDVLFIEVPHPDEILPGVDTHKHTPTLLAELDRMAAQPLCRTPGWDPTYLRTLYTIECPH